jgi:predicted DCC family thiol-disulfide oxidoreductase YuxK
MSIAAALARFGQRLFAGLRRAWSQLWFQSTSTVPLEVARMGLGGAMLVNYSLATPYLFELWGDEGWMPRAAALEINRRIASGSEFADSIFFYFTAPWQWIAFHAVFLFCCVAFMVGWRTSWVKWVVLAGEVSYNYRNQMLSYGVNNILSCILFVMCFAPIGTALSLDRVRAVRAAKHKNLEAMLPHYASPWAGACTRLIQIQIAVLFFYSGMAKVAGNDWWDGHAIWLTFVASEFYSSFLLDLFARHYWFVNVISYATILLQVAYPFLIWQQSTRPYLLAAAELLHLGFAVWLGLVYFSLVMLMGHMSFVRPKWLTGLGTRWKQKMGDMEMIYDGRCSFCVRSMAWLLAFDGLRQIRIRDFRSNPSPVVDDAQLEKALYLVLSDGRALPGLEAYRHVVLRVPGLWWLIPFFYVPVVSRRLGHPIYDWIAANRGRLSSFGRGVTCSALSPQTPAQGSTFG